MKSGNVSFDFKRFVGIKRDYSKEDVEKLKGTFNIEYTLCKSQSEKLWNLLNPKDDNRLASKNQEIRQFSEKGLYVREDDQDWGSAGMNDIQKDSE